MQLIATEGRLEAEKRQGEDLDKMSKHSERSSDCWWEKPIEELGLDELQMLKAAMEELKRNRPNSETLCVLPPSSWRCLQKARRTQSPNRGCPTLTALPLLGLSISNPVKSILPPVLNKFPPSTHLSLPNLPSLPNSPMSMTPPKAVKFGFLSLPWFPIPSLLAPLFRCRYRV
ncbi:hypothetical protein ACLB2K_066715 [Fragaria x ananassa]